MIILMLTTFSVFGLIASGYVLIAKTPPLISGGKGVYKYSKFRSIAVVVIMLILVLNVTFIASDFGNNFIENAIFGTPTLSTSTAEPIVVILSNQHTQQLTPTTTPLSPEDIVKIEFYSARCGSETSGRDFLFPDDIDLNQDVFELMKRLYSQEVWKVWNYLSDLNTYVINITNIKPNGGIIIVDNLAYLNIESYKYLGNINVANFSKGDGYFFGDDPCGGGAFAQPFDVGLLRPKDHIVIKTKEFDYFTIQPGEQEEFVVKFVCAEPGLYNFHIEMDISFFGNKKRLQVSPSITAFCPESYNLWVFTDVVNQEPHSVYLLGKYKLQQVDKSKIELDAFTDWKVVYSLSEPATSWVQTQPWQPCSNAQESFIYHEGSYRKVIVNPKLDTKVNLRDKPSTNGKIVRQLLPGQVLRAYSFECADRYVWWEVEGNDNENGGLFGGWVVEKTEEDIILMPCFSELNCENEYK